MDNGDHGDTLALLFGDQLDDDAEVNAAGRTDWRTAITWNWPTTVTPLTAMMTPCSESGAG